DRRNLQHVAPPKPPPHSSRLVKNLLTNRGCPSYAFPALAFAMPRLIAARWAADNFFPRSLLTLARNCLWPFVLSALIAARIWDSFISTLSDTASSLPSSFRSTFRTSIHILQF